MSPKRKASDQGLASSRMKDGPKEQFVSIETPLPQHKKQKRSDFDFMDAREGDNSRNLMMSGTGAFTRYECYPADDIRTYVGGPPLPAGSRWPQREHQDNKPGEHSRDVEEKKQKRKPSTPMKKIHDAASPPKQHRFLKLTPDREDSAPLFAPSPSAPKSKPKSKVGAPDAVRPRPRPPKVLASVYCERGREENILPPVIIPHAIFGTSTKRNTEVRSSLKGENQNPRQSYSGTASDERNGKGAPSPSARKHAHNKSWSFTGSHSKQNTESSSPSWGHHHTRSQQQYPIHPDRLQNFVEPRTEGSKTSRANNAEASEVVPRNESVGSLGQRTSKLDVGAVDDIEEGMKALTLRKYIVHQNLQYPMVVRSDRFEYPFIEIHVSTGADHKVFIVHSKLIEMYSARLKRKIERERAIMDFKETKDQSLKLQLPAIDVCDFNNFCMCAYGAENVGALDFETLLHLNFLAEDVEAYKLVNLTIDAIRQHYQDEGVWPFDQPCRIEQIYRKTVAGSVLRNFVVACVYHFLSSPSGFHRRFSEFQVGDQYETFKKDYENFKMVQRNMGDYHDPRLEDGCEFHIHENIETCSKICGT
ncbi:hypothetical protein MMC09_004242 [Bachmanniomyces sp. S44760]|nr:hypothetical protein [Bachmanniomyces sp. S44760]